MMILTLKYSKNNDFHDFLGYLFLFLFLFHKNDVFCGFSILYSISVIFLCFLYRGKFATLQ